MTDPKNVVTNEKVAGRSKLTDSSEAARISDGKRPASDERRFQECLEDDEVREALRVLRGTESTTQGRRRP